MEHEVSFQVRGEARPSVRIADGVALIEAVVQAGLPIARACDAGGLCARCGLSVLSGQARLSAPDAEEGSAKQRNRVPDDFRLACQARVHGDVLVTAAYW